MLSVREIGSDTYSPLVLRFESGDEEAGFGRMAYAGELELLLLEGGIVTPGREKFRGEELDVLFALSPPKESMPGRGLCTGRLGAGWFCRAFRSCSSFSSYACLFLLLFLNIFSGRNFRLPLLRDLFLPPSGAV